MRKILDFILSLKFSGFLLLLIAFATAYATFIENDFGAVAAKAAVYNARWFEVVILLAFINIAYNTFLLKPIKTKRYMVFLFHLAFLIIIIGAAATRYVGYEGSMSIREGKSSNTILSQEMYIQLQVTEDGETYTGDDLVLFSPIASKKGKFRIKTPQTTYKLVSTEFVNNAQEFTVEGEEGPKMLSLSATINGQFMRFSLFEGETKSLGQHSVVFNPKSKIENAFLISENENGLFITLPADGKSMSMMSSKTTDLLKDTSYPLEEGIVYQADEQSVVLKKYYKHTQTTVDKNPDNQANGLDAVKFTLSNSEGKQIESYALGRNGYYASPNKIHFDGKVFEARFGPKIIELPFSLYLKDFILERYPASNSPSSFASEVTLLDERTNTKRDFRIFMNNVLDYEGYRFFQSSYDTDEKGTVLSVNHDSLGKNITYIGYALMMLAMFFALFEKSTRFQTLVRSKTTTVYAVAILMLMSLTVLPSKTANAQASIQKLEKIPAQHLDNFSKLIVQGHSGRFKPLNSVTDETVRKFSRRNTFNGLSSDQMFLGMMLDPEFWMRQDLIKVSNNELKNIISNQNPRASFNDFFNPRQQPSYKLSKYIDVAYRKNPSLRTTLDKDIVTVDERVNVFYMAVNGHFLNLFPVPNHPDEPWKNSLDKLDGFPSADSAFVKSILGYYISALDKGIRTNQWDDANFYLDAISKYQQKYAAEAIKDTSDFNLEVLYNRYDIFKQLAFVNGLLGFFLLVLLFIKILWPKYKFKWAINILVGGLFLAFIAHTGGLILRWYIAGHAPWSNGYESMIFIGWASMLAGISFYKKAPMALAATAVLTFLILYVAHLSWMNPEITNLAPVLKSYWLTIHVAVITASYGFFALGSFLGVINLTLMILQNKSNYKRIHVKIKELTRINEAALIAGIYLLTVGTFLGGVWANESWGRYWGWDPKETWAFITILVYAFVLHMRSIQGLRGSFTFNVGSIFSYGTVLMTYFGVNYYLSGMHSYAQGDPMPIPNFVYYTVIILLSLSIFAYFAHKKYKIK